jgi:hypothetical protein
MATNLGVARYIADDPFDVLRMQTTETSFNLDSIWGGNMYANAAGAHAANEFYVIEGSGNTYGMAGPEKSIATVIYNYAGLN